MHFMPRKILVATDFSLFARAATETAGVIARAFSSEVTLLHVSPLEIQSEVAMPLDSRPTSPAEYERALRERIEMESQIELSRLCGEGMYAKFLTVSGSPAKEIARVAKEGQFDLVVISTHGRTGFLHLAMGSVAESVMKTCAVPVLSIRPDCAAALPIESIDVNSAVTTLQAR